MLTVDFFQKLLQLGSDWNVAEVSTNVETSDVEITIDYTGHSALCPDTGEECSLYDHAPLRKWRHLDIMQYKTYIVCRLPRIRNSQGQVLTIKSPWADKFERHTYLFEHLAIDILKATKNQTKTAELMRCKFNVINRILHISTERGLERRRANPMDIKRVSLDEKSFQRGHKYITVLSSIDTKCIIDIVKGRSNESVNELYSNLSKELDLTKVEEVTMDMWKAYRVITEKRVPKAKIVYDRFHLIKYLNDAIDKVRRRETKFFTDLKNTRYIWLKNPENLTENQRILFESISKTNYMVSKAWEVRENFKALFRKPKTIQAAGNLLMNWMWDAKHKTIAEVNKVVEMFDRHFDGVCRSLLSSASNAFAERVNGKIQELKMSAKGYRNFENFRSAILFFNGGLDLYPLK
jgi:transposase